MNCSDCAGSPRRGINPPGPPRPGGYRTNRMGEANIPLDETYNGWSNRETWAIHLWLTSYEEAYRWARDLVREAGGTADGILQDEIAQAVWTFLDGGKPIIFSHKFLAGMIWDVGSFWRVDWNEVTEALRDE